MSYVAKADRTGGMGILTYRDDAKLMRLLGLYDTSNDAGRSNSDSVGADDPPGRDPEPEDRSRLGPYASAVAEANAYLCKRPGGSHSHGNSQLTPGQVRAIRRARRAGVMLKTLAAQYGMSASAIACAASGESHGKVEDWHVRPRPEHRGHGIAHGGT